MMTVHEVRVPIDELGKRMVERGVVDAPEHVCMLLDAELDEFVADPQAFADTIRSRQATLRRVGPTPGAVHPVQRATQPRRVAPT